MTSYFTISVSLFWQSFNSINMISVQTTHTTQGVQSKKHNMILAYDITMFYNLAEVYHGRSVKIALETGP